MSELSEQELLIQCGCEALWEREGGGDAGSITVDGVGISRVDGGFQVEMSGPGGVAITISPASTAQNVSHMQLLFAVGVLTSLCHHGDALDDVYGLRHADDPRYRSTNT